MSLILMPFDTVHRAPIAKPAAIFDLVGWLV